MRENVIEKNDWCQVEVDRKSPSAGNIFMRWHYNGQETWHELEDFPAAIRQTGKVIGRYLGAAVQLNRKILAIRGENSELRRLIQNLGEIIMEIIDPDLDDVREAELDAKVHSLRTAIGAVRDAYKLAAQAAMAAPYAAAAPASPIDKARGLADAEKHLLERLTSTLNIVEAAYRRREKLQSCKRRIDKIHRDLIEQVAVLGGGIQGGTADDKERKTFGRRYRKESPSYGALARICRLNPWRKRGQRDILPQLRRLGKLVAVKNWGDSERERFDESFLGLANALDTIQRELEMLPPRPIKTLDKRR